MQRLCQGSELPARLPLRTQLLVSAAMNRATMPNLASTLQLPTRIPAPSRWSLVHARPKLDPCRYRVSHRCRPVRASRAGRNGGAIRHLDGRHSPDDGPAGSRRRRLSIYRFDHLRSAGRLGNGRGGPARQTGAGARHRMEGRRHRQDQMALHLAQGREVSRRQRLQRRRGDLESRQGAQRQGTAIRQAPERAGQDPPALGQELRQDRRFNGRDHDQDGRTRSSPTRCSGS